MWYSYKEISFLGYPPHRPLNQGLSWDTAPRPPRYPPQCLLIFPNLGCLDKILLSQNNVRVVKNDSVLVCGCNVVGSINQCSQTMYRQRQQRQAGTSILGGPGARAPNILLGAHPLFWPPIIRLQQATKFQMH